MACIIEMLKCKLILCAPVLGQVPCTTLRMINIFIPSDFVILYCRLQYIIHWTDTSGVIVYEQKTLEGCSKN